MQVVPSTFLVGGLPVINPWKLVDDARQFWEVVTDALWWSPKATVRRHNDECGISASEFALVQFNQVQWLLYKRHIKRSGWRMGVSPVRECWRFSQWTRRHSKNFRQLLALYQIEWFKRYADLMSEITDEKALIACQLPEVEQLFREIEFHLYQ